MFVNPDSLWDRGITLYLFGRARAPKDGRKMDQIWRKMRFQQDFYDTLSTFHPLPPPPIDLEKLHLCSEVTAGW